MSPKLSHSDPTYRSWFDEDQAATEQSDDKKYVDINSNPCDYHPRHDDDERPKKLKKRQIAPLTHAERVLAERYSAVFAEALAARKAYYEKLATDFAPCFNARVKQKYEQEQPNFPEERSAFVDQILLELDNLGLALFDPETGKSARLLVTGRGHYRLVPIGESNGKARENLIELLPFALAVAASHKNNELKNLGQVLPTHAGSNYVS